MSTSKTIVVKSSDGETFEVEAAVAMESQTIKHLIDDNCADTSIPLPDVTGKILAKVIEYCKRHVDAPKSDDKAPEDDLKKFEEEFGKVDHNTFFDLILAAHYLNIGSLLNLTRQTLADLSKGKNREEASRENSWAYDETVTDTSMMKSLEEIRKTSNIRNDFTPEAEDEARRKILTIKNDFLLTEQELFCRQNPWAFE